MIEKEAINVMAQAREDAGQAFLEKVQFNVPQYHAVIKALEKQIPKKPIKYKYEIVCPSCKTLVGSSPYCRYCGQALDWGEEECGS